MIVERVGREDAGTYECWDTKGEAMSRTKQVVVVVVDVVVVGGGGGAS